MAAVFEGNLGRIRWSLRASVVLMLLCVAAVIVFAFLVPVEVLLLLAMLFGVLFVTTTVMLTGLVSRPPRLAIDPQGITVSARGFQSRLLWSDIRQVRIVERPNRALDRAWLVAWLRPEVPKPPNRWLLPEWTAELGGLKLVDLTYLDATPHALRDALARHAGGVFDPSTQPM
jgi:hypothetical protein